MKMIIDTELTPYENIKAMAEAIGETINSVGMEAGVNPQLIYRWKTAPNTFVKLAQIGDALARMEAQKKELQITEVEFEDVEEVEMRENAEILGLVDPEGEYNEVEPESNEEGELI